MMGMYLVRKAIDYYQYEGLIGVAAAALRKSLWSVRQRYRQRCWAKIKSRPNLTIALGSLKLTLNPDDTGISCELAVEGTHEPVATQLMLEMIREGMVTVDIGANIGYYALQIALRVGTQGRVIAFEPAPNSYGLLVQNIHQNGLTNVQAYPYAIGSTRKEMDFFLYEQSNWNSFVKHGEPIGRVKVLVVPLDEILPSLINRVDLIRMDIEGHELEAIQGMKNTLRRHQPILCMELHGSFMPLEEVRTLLHELIELGYDIKYAILRSKDEIYWKRLIVPANRIIERISIYQLLHDNRLNKYQENFSLILTPAPGAKA
jgi:FkbM family methyltransferase